MSGVAEFSQVPRFIAHSAVITPRSTTDTRAQWTIVSLSSAMNSGTMKELAQAAALSDLFQIASPLPDYLPKCLITACRQYTTCNETGLCADHAYLADDCYIRNMDLNGGKEELDPMLNTCVDIPPLGSREGNREDLKQQCRMSGCTRTTVADYGTTCHCCLSEIDRPEYVRCCVLGCHRPHNDTSGMCAWHEYCWYAGYTLSCFRCTAPIMSGLICTSCQRICEYKVSALGRTFCGAKKLYGSRFCGVHKIISSNTAPK